MRRLTASQTRVARLVDVHQVDVIPPLRDPQIKRWEADGLLIVGESSADEWRGVWNPQAWWCQPAAAVDASNGGWARWYRWRRPSER